MKDIDISSEMRKFEPYATISNPVGFLQTLSQFADDIQSLKQNNRSLAKVSKRSLAVQQTTPIQEIQRLLLNDFRQPSNLTIAKFANLAGKSRQQIYKDIQADRYLSFCLNGRGRRIPDWQLDPRCLLFTQSILSKTSGVNEWLIYSAMTANLDTLNGQSPIVAFQSSEDHLMDSIVDLVVKSIVPIEGEFIDSTHVNELA